MHDIITLIREKVRLDVGRGKAVDVDECCRLFAPMCPDLTIRQLEEMVLQVVIAYGGGAVWGTGRAPDRSGGNHGAR